MDNMTHTEIPPLDVRIISGTVDIGEKRPREYRASHRTFVLTAVNPFANVAGFDPARKCVSINVLDNSIVLSESISQANDPQNITIANAYANPNGRLLAVSNGSEYYLETQDELSPSSNVYPTRVGVTLIREV